MAPGSDAPASSFRSSRPVLDTAMDLLTFVVVAAHVFVCPYTKVEESFNAQAIHDIVKYGISGTGLKQYDHFEFPGVVPRTFIGPLVVSGLMSPFVACGLDPKHYLILARIIIGGISVYTLGQFRRAFGSKMVPANAYPIWSTTFTLLVCSQFHLPFYMSRPLPNTFALALMNLGLAAWMRNEGARCVSILAFACAVFRADCILLAGPLLLTSLLLGRFKWGEIICYGFLASILSISATALVDTYFWSEPIWPEAQVLYYNTVLNKSHNWGTQPFHWYWTSALPRALSGGYILFPLALFRTLPTIPRILENCTKPWQPFQLDRRRIEIIVPSIIFIFLYSFLPHKELRFIFPSLPIFNALSSLVLAQYFTDVLAPEPRQAEKLQKLKLPGLLKLGYIEATCAAFIVLLSFMASLVFLRASSLNYPGGDALEKVHFHFPCPPQTAFGRKASIHIANIAAINGITRFGQLEDCFTYSKDENLSTGEDFQKFDLLVSETEESPTTDFEVVFSQDGFSHVDIRNRKIHTRPMIFVHAKHDLVLLSR